MSLEMRDVGARLERLERENRRLKKWGALAACALGGLGLFGFAAPAICDGLYGERLVIRNNRGQERLTFDAYMTQTPTLGLHDATGRSRARLGLDDKGDVTLSLYDESGNAKASYKFAADVAPKTEEKARDEKPAKTDPSMALR
jgi:hypothetical protein